MSSDIVSPPNFSWAEPRKLAGLGRPSRAEHYRFLLKKGIRHLICLCEDKPPLHESCADLTLHHIAIVDFTPPSLEQIHNFLSIVDEANSKGQAVGVHCMYGKGRTGTMLACYLVKVRNISAEEAVREIRKLRPGSIETMDQEQAVLKFQQHLQKPATRTN